MSRLAICADPPSFIREYWGSEGLHNCKQIPYQLSHLQPPVTIFYTVTDKDLFKNSSVFKNNYIVYFEKIYKYMSLISHCFGDLRGLWLWWDPLWCGSWLPICLPRHHLLSFLLHLDIFPSPWCWLTQAASLLQAFGKVLFPDRSFFLLVLSNLRPPASALHLANSAFEAQPTNATHILIS